jgi:2-phospho-L-lactate/phosphoenolpyruvate guanylyltransferase
VRWSVVVPVKRLPLAKSRLYAVGRPRPEHEELALCLAVDTVAAALAATAVARLYVVTDDPAARAATAATGARVLPDEPDAGLNPALAHGAAVARRRFPRDGVALLSADLPALRPAELDAALAAAAGYGVAFVADASGTGTTLLATAPGRPVEPRYGRASAAAHRAAGAIELTGGWPSLRTDVDTAADLRTAAELGLGPATSGWTARHAVA